MPHGGMGTHQSAAAVTDTWLTPPHVLEAVGAPGFFDLDPCAAPEPRPWPTARAHYALPDQDGLALPWNGKIFMNPPYGSPAVIGPWLRRLAAHPGGGVALIFARTETEVFHQYV